VPSVLAVVKNDSILRGDEALLRARVDGLMEGKEKKKKKKKKKKPGGAGESQ